MAARSASPRRKSNSDRRLETYRAKRDFAKSPEPSGKRARRKPREAGWSFVVQKHAARNLHYDFRLELDGVLLSWAVPKGPSLSPGTRRLAMRTEDHPIDYAGFEGVIPEHEYGGGAVVVWDQGTWEPESDPHEGLKRGRLTFELHGEKLLGRWHLVRTRGEGKGEPWLLFKGRDEAASDSKDIVQSRPESVLSGRTIEEVRTARDRVWHSNRGEREEEDLRSSAKSRARSKSGSKGASKAGSKSESESKSKGSSRRTGSAEAAKPAKLEDLVKALPGGVPLTNLDKVLYPERGITKAALIAYLAIVAKPMLAQIAGRPLTLVRCPEGRHHKCFFQKHVSKGTHESIGTVEIEENDGKALYMRVHDVSGLVALAQMGTLEIHTWGCHADKVERPDQLVMDLDPDVSLGWESVVEAAFELRSFLKDLGLETLVKTTGGKGLHVVAPIKRGLSWDDFKSFAKSVAESFAGGAPKRYTTNPLKASRRGRVFIDYLRNARGATAIAAYSPRARENAPVAMPVSWRELERGIDPGSFTIETVPSRITAVPDPWRGYESIRQSISASARRRLAA